MTSLAKLNSVVSAGRKVKQGLADTAVDELRDEWRKITQDFTAQAKAWFPDGAWNVQDARSRGLLPYIRDAAQAYIDRLANAMVAKVQDSRRKACLSALGANKVAMAVLGQVQAKSDAQIIRDGPVLESLRILGRRVTVYREADTPDEDEGRWVTIRGRHVFIKHGESPKDALAKSLGRDASGAQPTDSREFKMWFGDSKAVDKNGKPVVVYHGTAKEFDTFSRGRIGANFGKKPQDQGFWFTDSKDQALEYASNIDGTKQGKVAMSAYVRITNPAIWGDTPENRPLKGSFVKKALADGHDGVIFRGIEDGTGIVADQYLVFKPEQVRRAAGYKRESAQSAIPINTSITGHNRARLIAAIERYVPPSWWNLPKTIRYRVDTDPNSEFDGIHGEWTDGKEIVLNPSIFESKETFGTKDEGQLHRAEHTICHEYCHAYGDSAKLDESPEWLALSGWHHMTGLTPEDKGRYVENRPGWPKEDSSWVHDKSAWFIRPYSAKSPAEDFADCAMAVLVGWANKFDGGGEAKRDWVVSVLGGVSRVVKQREADKPIKPEDALSEPPAPEAQDRRLVARIVIREPEGVWIFDPQNEPLVMFPGGGVADGESFQDAAIREAKEETGFDVELMRYIADFSDEHSVRRYYMAKRTGGEVAKQDEDGGGKVKVRLVSDEQALDQLTSAFDKAALLLTQGKKT